MLRPAGSNGAIQRGTWRDKCPQFAPISGVVIAQVSGRNLDETTLRACREQARRYRELARAAVTPELARTFAELAESWTVMADEIERALEREHDRT